MVDPRRCPVPPGFYLRGEINDDFNEWNYFGYPQHTTEYSSSGKHGYSHRWDNRDVRSANIVAGFQFKIGPHIAQQWQEIDGQTVYFDITKCSVDLKFPRMNEPEGDPTNRGVYMLTIDCFADGSEVDGRKAVGKAGKEFPHPITRGYFFNEFGGPGSDPRP